MVANAVVPLDARSFNNRKSKKTIISAIHEGRRISFWNTLNINGWDSDYGIARTMVFALIVLFELFSWDF